mgnify:CR=1 FL=1
MDKGPPRTDHRKWVKNPPPGRSRGRNLERCGVYSRPSSSSSQREATASDGIRLVGADSIPLASAWRRKLAHFVAPPLPTGTAGVPAGPPMGDWRRRWSVYSRPSNSSSQREDTASDGIRLVGADSIPLASAWRRKLAHFVAPPLPTGTAGVPVGAPMGDWRRR